VKIHLVFTVVVVCSLPYRDSEKIRCKIEISVESPATMSVISSGRLADLWLW